MSGKKYVYSMNQANFYLQHGIIPIELGVGSKGDTYAVFSYEDHAKIFPLWIKTIHSWTAMKEK